MDETQIKTALEGMATLQEAIDRYLKLRHSIDREWDAPSSLYGSIGISTQRDWGTFDGEDTLICLTEKRSRCSCHHDYDDHDTTFPMEHLWMDETELRALLQGDVNKRNQEALEARKAAETAKATKQAEDDRRAYEVLKERFEGTNP